MRFVKWLVITIFALLGSTAWAQQDGEDVAAEEAPEESTEAASESSTDQPEDAFIVAPVSSRPSVYHGPEHAVGRMPGLWGQTGLFHLFTPDSIPPESFTIGLFGEFFQGSDVVRSGDENARFVGRLTASYTPIDHFEVFASLSGRGNENTYADPTLIQSQGDVILGGKGYSPFGEGFAAGGSLAIFFLNGPDSVGLDFSGTSLDIRAFLSYSLEQSAQLPIIFHLNTGFYLDNSDELFAVELQRVERFAHGVSEYNYFEVGLGVEVPVEYVTPFLEWNLAVPVGGSDIQDCATSPIPCANGFVTFPDVLTIGIKGTPIPLLALNLGVDIGLTGDEALGLPATPPYNVLFGASYNVMPNGAATYTDATLGPPTGWILGEVVDDVTGEIVSDALVTYPGTAFSVQMTDAGTGRFRSYEFPVDTEITIEVNHPDYEARVVTREVEQGEDPIRIRLIPGLDVAKLMGIVTDTTGTPLPGIVYVSGPIEDQFEVDPLTSEFEIELEPGRYVVTVVANGFVSDRREIPLDTGRTQLDVQLAPLPADQVAVLRGDRIDLSGERIRFDDETIDPDSEPILAQVADLLQQYPSIRVEIGAHTDDSGTQEETDTQAQLVMEYLVNLGIDASRLSAVGYGDSRPILPNINRRNRMRNRRVEFVFTN